MINTQRLHDNLKSQIELVKSGNYPDTLNLLAELQVIVRMIDDLNERITTVEHDLDAAGIPHDEKFRVQS